MKHGRTTQWNLRTSVLSYLLPMALVSFVPGAFGTHAEKVDHKDELSDEAIADAIEDQFLFDHSVDPNKVDVSVTAGVAELTGEVSHLLARDRAATIAEMVKGVRSVSNRLTIRPSEWRDDAAIRDAVAAALARDPATDAYELDVSVHRGSVTLSGEVESWAERNLSETVAKSVHGVTSVRNAIDVDVESNRLDTEIRPEIEKRLEWDVLVNDGLIDVAVVDGRVELSGIVGSASEKRRARTNAWVAGVRAVDDSGLEVQWWAQNDALREHKYVSRTDHEIAQAVHAAAVYDPRVASFDIRSKVDQGWVTLRGTVDNLKAKNAAEDIARHTVGVVGVTNRLKVRTIETRADEAIETEIKTALLNNPTTDSYEILVSVDDGRAVLSGMVDGPYEEAVAESVASKVRGVTHVRNFLMTPSEMPIRDYPWSWPDVWLAPRPTDEQIHSRIQDEFFWSPFVDGDDVSVEVQDAVATLHGTVQNWHEYRAAAENALEGGAQTVVNRLTVAPSIQ